MIPGLEIHQLIDDPVLQNKLFKLVDVFDEKQPLKRKTRQYGYEYDYKARDSHKDKNYFMILLNNFLVYQILYISIV